MSRTLLTIAAVLCLSACVNKAATVSSSLNQTAAPERFTVCRNHGCREQIPVTLDTDTWRLISNVFRDVQTAHEERIKVAGAIGLMERLVAEQALTKADQARNVFYYHNTPQLDCVDESVNTTTYLTLFAQRGLLRWHDVGKPARRGNFFNGLPHFTATMHDRAADLDYAVDSWFFANGENAVVLPLATWQDGWQPPPG